MVGDEVWVVTIRKAHGEDNDVAAVCDSREAAFDVLKAEGMTVYVDKHGQVQGRPRNENAYPAYWGTAVPMKIRGRKEQAG